MIRQLLHHPEMMTFTQTPLAWEITHDIGWPMLSLKKQSLPPRAALLYSHSRSLMSSIWWLWLPQGPQQCVHSVSLHLDVSRSCGSGNHKSCLSKAAIEVDQGGTLQCSLDPFVRHFIGTQRLTGGVDARPRSTCVLPTSGGRMLQNDHSAYTSVQSA